MVRLRLKKGLSKSSEKTKESNVNGKLSELEYVENYKYPNGAVYTGNSNDYIRSMEKW